MWHDTAAQRLIAAWRDARYAADLAARLADEAIDASRWEPWPSEAAGDLADLAEGAADAAITAAGRARAAAAAYRQAGDVERQESGTPPCLA